MTNLNISVIPYGKFFTLDLAKRGLDLIASAIGIVVFSPLFIVIATIVRKDGGPAFFRQIRVGRHEKLFRIIKFRTMVVNADKIGAQVTTANDSRITTIGRILRKTKIDELPQLFNVFAGQMSLVGPRPEVPLYVKLWTENDRKIVLSVRPGITDYASLFYNNEQEVLSSAKNPKMVYEKEIIPHKLTMYKKYVCERSFALDIHLLITTFTKIAGVAKKH